MDCSPPGSSVHGILQARILEWVAIPFSRGSSWPRNWTLVSYIADRRPTLYHLWVRPMGKDPSLPSTTSHQGSPSLHLNLWEMDRLSPKVTAPHSIPRAQSEHTLAHRHIKRCFSGPAGYAGWKRLWQYHSGIRILSQVWRALLAEAFSDPQF